MFRGPGDVAVTVGADTSDFEAGLKGGNKTLKDFETNAARMGTKFAKIGLAVGAVAVGIGAGMLKIASDSGEAARELTNLARVSGVGVEEFQKLAVAGERVGFSQEKMADIFKDVNDKFGDFMATGAGPLADFFENIAPAVGVTADQFARLSGPEALQLYVTSLERAGLSQQQMTFYMEALASDATALVPLLADNGREMRRLGDAAEAAGVIMSEETVRGADAMGEKLREVRQEIRGKLLSALVSMEDELLIVAQFINDHAAPALESLIGLAASAAEKFQALAGWMKSLGGNPQFFDPVTGNEHDQNRNVIGYNLGGNMVPAGDLLPPSTPLSIEIGGNGGGGSTGGGGGALARRSGGGGGGGASMGDFESLQRSLAERSELIEQHRLEQLEKLREFRDAKLATEAEFNDLELRINQEHAEAMGELESRAQRERLQSFSGALGDLASLMVSENKKLFKIGQAAAIAESVVSGYNAAVSAWDKGMSIGGPPLAAAFTAASLAKTGALISSIRSASPSGGASATAAGGGGVAAPVAAAGGGGDDGRRSQRVAIQLVGGDMFSRTQILQLFNEINDAVDDGALIRLV